MRRALPGVLVYLLACGATSHTQTRPDLDLSQVDRPTADGGAPGLARSTGGGSGPQAQQSLPIAVRLVDLSPSCSQGETLTYDVELRNISKSSVLLPWSVDSRDVGERSEDPAWFPKITITLRVSDRVSA